MQVLGHEKVGLLFYLHRKVGLHSYLPIDNKVMPFSPANEGKKQRDNLLLDNKTIKDSFLALLLCVCFFSFDLDSLHSFPS